MVQLLSILIKKPRDSPYYLLVHTTKLKHGSSYIISRSDIASATYPMTLWGRYNYNKVSCLGPTNVHV